MTLDLHECSASGPGLPEAFLRFELGEVLGRLGLLPKSGRLFEQGWDMVRRQVRALGGAGGPLRVTNHIIAPLAPRLGYGTPQRQAAVTTREGPEDGGWLMHAPDTARLRAWSVATDSDLDAPHRSDRAYRFSPTRSASRVLVCSGESAGLLTDGTELRLLLCDPARPDSHFAIPLAGTAGWQEQNLAPDSYRALLALAAPRGLAALPDLLDAARLSQARVTKDLRTQARTAVEGFLQAVLDDPANASRLRRHTDRDRLARQLWGEGLVLVYRLLFILKLESATDSARVFSFAATALWRHALSPNQALGKLVRRQLDHGHETGRMLADGIRTVFRVFRDGLTCSELSIAPLGGALFSADSTPLLDALNWSERSVALLLDRLLWTTPKGRERERVQYGPLDVEELGRVYEALLELEPGIASQPMMRLRRARLEVVVPADPARRYQPGTDPGSDDAESASRGNVVRKQDIQSGCFYLRVGLGRKATGSYYTPHEFVRFLVRETLDAQVRDRSPDEDPDPAGILALKIVDPATGSGHFLVEACRFLGEALYAACRLCDTQATTVEAAAAHATGDQPARLLARAKTLRARVAALPDPDQALLAYLPSKVTEGGDTGVSQSRALAICRRLVAVHCLYGVDRNPLAVELAKLSLWLESYAEGLPLTFLDHRLVQGDSLAGPFFAQLVSLPVSGGPLGPLLARGVAARLGAALHAALAEVRALQATVGRDAADLALKAGAKARLDAALHPLRQLARAWSGATMLGLREADDEFLALAQGLATNGIWPEKVTRRQATLLAAGSQALAWDLTFPEVFRPDAAGARTGGFDAVLGNPPWDIVQQNAKEFFAGFDLSILDAPTKREARGKQARLLTDPATAVAFRAYQEGFAQQHRVVDRLYAHQKVAVSGQATGGKLDSFRVFAERSLQLAGPAGAIGMVVPSSFHANEGATGIRRLYLCETDLRKCLSFENRRKLFDIHVRQKFALLVARRPGPTRTVRCGFYLDDFAQIGDRARIMRYDRAFIEKSGGDHLTFLELRSVADLAIARRVFLRNPSLRDWTSRHGIVLGREMNITDDAHRITPVAHPRRNRADYLMLHEGKTIQQFDDRWDSGPRYAVALSALQDKPAWQDAARYFRLALRKIARSTDERTAIAAFTSPGYLFNDTAPVERTPQRRCNAAALQLCAVINSFAFDWALRQKAAATVNLFILEACPACDLAPHAARFLAHGALRLSCNHAAFAPLWHEQLGTVWREVTPAGNWPPIAPGPARWRLRAAIDAVIAQAYGLTRSDYEHILASFAHKSFAAAPALCLAAFDALVARGPAAFCHAHDPYDDIRLVAAVAMPVGPCLARQPGRSVAA
ncbi:MAG TPA: hypothetical protein VND19_09595 [Acetobacteraceae bacterium]|nr:hypothetical protein [Acetobacteraceae bacterium]